MYFCCLALKIHISEDCYRRLVDCATHTYIMTQRGEVDIQVGRVRILV